ncbi:A24 family peptidase [Salinibaculum salinum]|uniref:A24 family peptidase n=1 Tax=Salinibaculum salinum TaxID=3131996 RepID=UPI0030EF619B
MFASIPDLLRLVAIPFFGYVAYRDIKTRRVSNRTWYPIAALAILLLVVDAYTVFEAGNSFSAQFERQRFLIGLAVSLLFVVPLVYGFWLIGGFGGADTKAFWVVALLFPVFPTYDLRELGIDYLLPVIEPNIPAFSLTILSNTVLVGIAYPFVLAARNAATGYLSPGMFVAKPVAVHEITEEYGTILSFPDRSLTDDLSLSGLRSYFSWRGLDIDALRMYLQYRGLDLADLRENPDRFRDPDTLPAEPNDPGDGSIPEAAVTDGGESVEREREPAQFDDPWGAEAFLDDIEGSAYGTSPEALREGLEMLVTEERVWISPGIPFLVPLFFGLVVSLTAGDLLFAILQTVGLA